MKPTPRNAPIYIPPALERCFQDLDGPDASPPPVFARAKAALKRYSDRWVRRYRLRQSLRDMDSYRVEKDIGVPVGTLLDEAHKPFWRE